MATASNHNGYVQGKNLFNKGDITWADKTSWTSFTSWIEHTVTTVETATGAKGTPLRYQTTTVDLGRSLWVWPEITVNCSGVAKVVIEYSDSVDGSGDISSPTINGYYTHNNTATGTVVTYEVLGYMQPGYTNSGNGDYSSTNYKLDYAGFKARYVRTTTYVENFTTSNLRGQAILYSIKADFWDTTIDFYADDVVPSDFTSASGPPTHYIGLSNRPGPVVSINITPHHHALYDDIQPVIINKTNGTPTFAVIDSDGDDIPSWKLDIQCKCLPALHETSEGVQRFSP